MTSQEAIDKINSLPIMRLADTSELQEALELALEALAKQVPMKPNDESYMNCPNCGSYCFPLSEGKYCVD